MVNRAEIEEIVRSVLGEKVKCRADYPHEDQLSFRRGNPSLYVCQCGQRYLKDGRGGLMEAPEGV